jgi:hypothetical protein
LAEPSSVKEYLERFHANQRVSGFGLEVANHLPCPWCAHPDFMVLYPGRGILPSDDHPDLDTQMSTEATCSNCGRSGKNVVERTPTSVGFSFFQTGGRDAPEWLVPPPPRLET